MWVNPGNEELSPFFEHIRTTNCIFILLTLLGFCLIILGIILAAYASARRASAAHNAPAARRHE